jgi:hypothetical protein
MHGIRPSIMSDCSLTADRVGLKPELTFSNMELSPKAAFMYLVWFQQ